MGGAHDPDTRRPSRPVVGLGPRGGVVPRLRSRTEGPRRGRGIRDVRRLLLLAGPGLLHLEPHDRREPPRRGRPARGEPRAGRPVGFRADRAGRRGRRCGDRLVRVRDLDRSGQRAAPAQGGGREGQGVDLPHHPARAQGARGAARHAPADGCRARREQGPADVEGAAAGGGREPRQHDAAVRAGHRRRPGRHRPGLAAAPAGRARPSSSTSTRGPATSGATGTSRSACTTRSGTTTCRT